MTSIKRHNKKYVGIGGIRCTCCISGKKSEAKTAISRTERRSQKQELRKESAEQILNDSNMAKIGRFQVLQKNEIVSSSLDGKTSRLLYAEIADDRGGLLFWMEVEGKKPQIIGRYTPGSHHFTTPDQLTLENLIGQDPRTFGRLWG